MNHETLDSHTRFSFSSLTSWRIEFNSNSIALAAPPSLFLLAGHNIHHFRATSSFDHVSKTSGRLLKIHWKWSLMIA